jgi:hypothetical protein
LGGTSVFWNYIDCAYYYAKYTTFIQFDALDDLALVKNYRTKTVGEREVIDFESLPMLKPDYPEKQDSVDMSKLQSFLLGCLKALVLRVEEIEKATQKS